MTILDSIKQVFKKSPEISPEAKGPKPNTSEIGYADSLLYGTKDFPKYNPDALLTYKGAKIYRKMMLDDQVKPVTEFKKAAVISRGYYFDVETDEETGEPIKDQQEMADFFGVVIKRIKGSFTDNLMGILSAMINGFSITEKVYAPIQFNEKEYWGVKDLKLRPFDSFNGGFTVDNHGNILELNQVGLGTDIPIPMDKVIHFVHQPDIDPHYGESDLRAAYRAWWAKDITIKFQNIHLERHASGFIWAQVKGELPPVQKTRLENLIKNISARTGAILPDSVKLESFSPLRTDAYDRAIAQHDKAIAKSILVPNLLGLSEQGNTGSYSQSQTQLTAFFWILDAIANRLAETLNDQLFKQLALWNFGTAEFPPFTFEPISDQQKEIIARAWGELISKGAVTKTDSDEDWIRRLMGAPEKVEEEEPEDPEFPEGNPDEPIEIPDNQDWVEEKPEDQQQFILKEFAEKPWLRRVNFARLEKTLDKNDQKFIDEIIEIMALVSASVEKQIIKLFGERSGGNIQPKELEGIKPPPGLVARLRKAIRGNLSATLNNAYDMAVKELPKKKFRVAGRLIGTDKTQIEKYLSSKALKVSDTTFYRTFDGVQRVLENSMKYDKTLRDTMAALWEDTDISTYLPTIDAAGRAVNVPARLENIVRTNNADAVNQARMSLFGNPEFKGFIVAYEYSAILDSRISAICEHLHGKILKDFSGYTPPNHFQCRSILVPVTAIDGWDGKESPKPRVQPHKGFA